MISCEDKKSNSESNKVVRNPEIFPILNFFLPIIGIKDLATWSNNLIISNV